MTTAPPEADLPCPRCGGSLALTAGGTGLGCTSCRGLFVFKEALEGVLAESAALGGVASYRAPARQASSDTATGKGAYEPAFRYLACPRCSRTMNRQNFMKRSGVIVDVCLHHGTWFDDDEARRAGEWVAAGGKPPVEEPVRSSRPSAPVLSGAQLLIESLGRLRSR